MQQTDQIGDFVLIHTFRGRCQRRIGWGAGSRNSRLDWCRNDAGQIGLGATGGVVEATIRP